MKPRPSDSLEEIKTIQRSLPAKKKEERKGKKLHQEED
jgi:hypothetical protein